MSNSLELTTSRLQRDVPAAEARIDDALIAISSLMGSVVTARRETAGVPAVKGQATIHLLAQAQLSLVDVSANVLRVHGNLVDIGRETGGLDLHECPALAADTVVPIAAAAQR